MLTRTKLLVGGGVALLAFLLYRKANAKPAQAAAPQPASSPENPFTCAYGACSPVGSGSWFNVPPQTNLCDGPDHPAGSAPCPSDPTRCCYSCASDPNCTVTLDTTASYTDPTVKPPLDTSGTSGPVTSPSQLNSGPVTSPSQLGY